MAILFILMMIGLFVILGVLLINGKGSFLIAGYNTMSPEEKEKYDVKSLCKFMGKMMFVLAVSMLFWVFGEAYDVEELFYVGLFLVLAIVLFMVIYMNTGNRFKK